MTPHEFLDRYPDTEEKGMNLTDVACTNCGNREHFLIETRENRLVYDDYTEEYGERDWDRTSYCECRSCGEEGTLQLFIIEGLDDLIRRRALEEFGILPPTAQTQPAPHLTPPPAESAHF